MSTNKISQPSIGIGVLIWREKKLLLGRRINQHAENCWQFPGGHLEQGESVSFCAQREVKEETGLCVNSFRHLGFTDKPFNIGQRQYITLLVSCDHESGEAQTLEPDKCEGWSWFDYRQLPSPLFEPISIFMAQHAGPQAFVSRQDDLYALHRAAHVLPDTPSIAAK